ncbi:MAG: hypothetical protein EZS28_021612, partial [Streblomastix strix]
MFDATTWVNGNQSVVIAVTTSEAAIVNAVKKSARAQPTSLHLSRGRPPKIVVISVPATHEAQIPRVFLPPLANFNSRKTTNSVERKYFEEVGEQDMKQGKQRAAHPNNKQDSSIIASFNGESHKKIADQYRQLGSLNARLLDLIFGVSSYLILLHFLILTLFSHLIWSIEAQIHRHQKQMNKNKHNINLLVYLLVFSSIFGIFNVGAIGVITQDNGIGSSTLNSTNNNIMNITSANKININSSSFIQSSKQTNADIAFYQSDDGNDGTNDCLSDSAPCQTINHILGLEPPSGYSKGTDKIIINTMSPTNMQNKVVIDSSRPLGNIVQIQSSEYASEGTDYSKQSIRTSSYSNTLFTIADIGNIQLLGLHFDNLKTTSPSSNNPLISIQSDSNDIPQLSIIDCEFELDAPDSQIYHSIISINGGIMKMERTKIQNYKLMNGMSLINIKSDKVSTVTISQTTFTSIAQNGAVINAQLQQDSVLKVTDSCIFSNCSTQQGDNNRGGAINAVVDGSNSQFIVSDLVKFEKCQSFMGGAISVDLLNMGTCVVNNVQFQGSTENNDGGGIVAQLQETGGTLTITNHTSFVQCINTMWGVGGGGILIGSYGSNSRCIISDNVIFEKSEAIMGGAIAVQQRDGASFDVHNVIFKECNSYYMGGAIYILQYEGGSFDVHDVTFEKCEAVMGGAIFIEQQYGASFEVHNVKLKECEAQNQGGAICVQQFEGASFDVHDVTFEKCEAVMGGAIFIEQQYGASFEVHDVIFEKCEAGMGGAIIIGLFDGASFEVHNVTFKECEAQDLGGAIYIIVAYYGGDMGSGTATISESTFSGSKSVNRGGAIYTQLYADAALTIDKTQFNLCYSTDSDGGSIFALIDEGSLSLNQVIFTDCNCTQPGSGGAIAIVQQNSNCRISITESSFTNCKTLLGSSRYGWGGAIYIEMGFEAYFLTLENFQLTDLSFTNCKASGAGNNIHIRSPNTYNSGIAIAANSLVTVKDLSGLYTNDSYSNDYMGIDESMVNDGNTQISDHQALFLAGQRGFITKEYYIKSPDGYDTNDCQSSSPCKTINNILSKSLPTGFVKGLSIVVIKLLSDTSDQDNIFINSGTKLNNILTVQSNGYQSGGTENTKQSIQTQQRYNSLFTISNTGRLKLFGLHFDNLNPTSNNPLISIQSDSNDIPLLSIIDCEFESSIPNTNHYHSIISINGGILKIERTTIENYIFDNGISLINIKLDQSSTVTISQTTFASIAQTGTGNGSVINAELNGASKLTIKEGSSFSSCSSSGNGGAIYGELNEHATLTIDNGIFKDCNCTQPGNGGALCILQQTDSSKIFITDSSFTNCLTLPGTSNQYGWGGAIYIDISYNPPSLTATNFQLTYLSFTNCKASGAGNNLHILSDDTATVGNQIKTGSLVTVKDTSKLPKIISNLYTNEWYCFDYMGINKTKADSGNAPFTDHEPLFISPSSLTPKFNDPYLADAEYGKDEPICGNTRLKCYTIKYILSIDKDSFDNYPSEPATINIELQTSTYKEEQIMINSTTKLGNNFKIQSSGYTTGGTDYIKRQIRTQQKSSTLFTITGTGHLQLLGLHFDNLQQSATTALISMSTSTSDIPQLQINDCEFESDAPDSQIYHSIISINGGIMKIERTTIENYIFDNGISLINIKSDQSSTVTISQTTFASIAQTGTGNGAAINAELSGTSKLTIKDSCQFSSCSSATGSGGAIFAQLTNGTIYIDDIIFSTCNCTQPGNGGAIAIVQEYDGKIIINNVQFTSCKTLTGNGMYGWGGSIFIKTSIAASSLSEDNFYLTNLIFSIDCSSIANAGHYIDIQSLDTAETGANIASKNLLSVNDTTNLYTNETYGVLYMGIRT